MITVDARGFACPEPVIRTKKALDVAGTDEVVEVLVDNEISLANVSKFGNDAGAKVTTKKVGDGHFRVLLELGESRSSQKETDQRTIAVIDSETMGEGSEELGKVLMKGFVYALSQLDVLPDKVLFYNGGAKLTCTGSDSLEDLQYMEGEGVEIMTCGTCLDFFKLKEELSVGQVTNMYSIVEAMNSADHIMKP
ncbi:sulfurtransferase-like selenium metabolism protein YedF [Ohessyouella blattaphilus]|uniref:Sulfurtransferase-like selenium metabolism protein YedF n=1 Tax=Ohessyouella blattaphilus TaxID=2949333 RepID=A0ABT1EIP0_9FIRM|nr:sulfurtransferase-like selenium metabolism protein YedF [Ohessyouella blattaphilus]MCP1110572.1 sulfurtransferase-like selenium metabolism protein YedF [Ohessyouella blattaphilus]MCR8563966.1 sulfurtransferase-like selenium metabolism protein YedF [Ohessyouella blattaphilus]